jgi:hypothetical protein
VTTISAASAVFSRFRHPIRHADVAQRFVRPEMQPVGNANFCGHSLHGERHVPNFIEQTAFEKETARSEELERAGALGSGRREDQHYAHQPVQNIPAATRYFLPVANGYCRSPALRFGKLGFR